MLTFYFFYTDIIAEVTEYSNVNDGFKLSINLELIDEEQVILISYFIKMKLHEK